LLMGAESYATNGIFAGFLGLGGRTQPASGCKNRLSILLSGKGYTHARLIIIVIY